MFGILRLSDKERVNKRGVRFNPWVDNVSFIVNTNLTSKIDRWAKVHPETGELMEVYGPVGNKETEIRMLLYHFNIRPCRYPLYNLPKLNYDTDVISVFSVDNPGTLDMDDALNVIELGVNHYKVGVHITNVVEHINDELYNWALQQGSSAYFNETQGMLPPDLAQNHLSLIEFQPRKCLTLWIEYKEGQVVDLSHDVNTVINKNRLNYDNFEMVCPDEYHILKVISKEELPEDIVAWTMVQYNKYFAELLINRKIGLLRSNSEKGKTAFYTLPTKDNVHHNFGCNYTHMTSPIRRFADLYNQMCFFGNDKTLTEEQMRNLNSRMTEISQFHYTYAIVEMAYNYLEKPVNIRITPSEYSHYVYAHLPNKRVRIPTHESYYENNVGPSGKCVDVWGIIRNGKASLRISNEDHSFKQEEYIEPPNVVYDKYTPCNKEELKELTENFLGYELDTFQLDCLEVISKGRDVLGMAPTGSGKTAVAIIGIMAAFSQDKRVIYTSPIKALSNEKYNTFYKQLYGRVTLLTGDIKARCSPKGGDSGGELLIMTAEILKNKLVSSQTSGVLDPDLVNVSVVIQDEVHYINDPERGPVWEETTMFLNKEIQVISLSATLSNAESFSNWLNQRRQTTLVQRLDRHVPLYLGKIDDNTFKSLYCTHGVSSLKSDEYVKETEKSFSQLVQTLIRLDKCPAIVFCMSRKGCVEAAQSINSNLMVSSKPTRSKDYPDDLWETMLNEHGVEVRNYEQKWNAIWNKTLRKYRNELETIPGWNREIDLLKRGIGYHHAGMIPLHREFVEQLFQHKMLKVVFATETLGVGINMPTRTVVFTQLDKPTEKETRRWIRTDEFWQMAGRAGRRGMDEKGFVIYYPMKKIVPFRVFSNMILSKPEPTVSKLKIDEMFVLRNLHKGIGSVDTSLLHRDHSRQIELMVSEMEDIEIDDIDIEIIRLEDKLEQKVFKLTPKQIKNTRKELRKIKGERDTTGVRKHIERLKRIEDIKRWEHDIWDKSKHRLTMNNFIYNNDVTLKGMVARQLTDGSPLSRAEILCSNVLDNCDFITLACVLSHYIPMNRIHNEESLMKVPDYINDILIKNSEQAIKYDFEVNDISARLMYIWCSTKDINRLSYYIPIYQLGSFVKLILRVASFMEELEKVLLKLEKYKLKNTLINFQEKLFYGIVTNQSLYI